MSETITTKPFASRAQAGWAFATGQPFARRWAKQTGPYKRLPYKVRKKALAAIATTKDYAQAGAIAEALALKGESLAPGVTRIHGDLCNVHGRYGSCRAAGFGAGPSGSKRVAPKALPKAPTPKKGGGKKAGGKGAAKRTPIKTEAQKRQEQDQKRQERAQAKLAEQQANRKQVLEKMGIAPDGQDALKALQDGAQPDPTAVKRAGLVEAGLAEQAKDGSYRLTASGRAVLSAADAGDAGRAGATISAARDRTTARTERQTAAQQRQAAAAARRAAAQQRRAGGSKPKAEPKPKPAPKLPSGGGGNAPKPVVGGGGGGGARSQQQSASIPAALASAVQDLSDGKTLDQATIDALVRNGLARLDKDGKPSLTGQGLRVLSKGKAAYSSGSKFFGGDTSSTEPPVRSTTVNHLPQPKHLIWPMNGKRTTIDALQAGQSVRAVRSGSDRMSTLSPNSAMNSIAQKAGSPGDYLVVEDPQKPSTWHLQVRTNGKPDHRLMGAAWAALHPPGYRGNVYQGPNKGEALSKLRKLYASEGMDLPSEKSFAVFKDATGAYRWIARTTTAYRDRDGEIISEKALEDDVARMNATGQFGPLRYWHIGQPDPFDTDAPWGPGLDIGDCDFSIVIGRTNLESGTFKDADLGAAFADAADEHELSPGFFHAIGEPDASGVFDHIRRFERSIVPVQHARASNLFTGLHRAKEHAMDQATYDKRVKAYIDFARTKGVSPEATAAPLIAMEQADKTAGERRIAFKAFDWFKGFMTGELPDPTTTEEVATAAEPPAEPDPPADPVAALKAQIEALTTEVATLKAPPVDAGMGMMGGDAETPAEDVAEGGVEEPGEDGGLTLSPDDLAAIGQAVGAALEPLIGALGITQKLEGHLGELKTMMGGYVKQKDDEAAQRQNEIASLKASIDQQQAKLAELLGDQPRGGYRPTQATDNIPSQVLAAMKDQAPDPNDWSDMTSKFFPGMLPG